MLIGCANKGKATTRIDRVCCAMRGCVHKSKVTERM